MSIADAASAQAITDEMILGHEVTEPLFQIRTEGIVWKVWPEGKDGVPLAKVFIPMIHPQNMSKEDKDKLDWNIYETKTLNKGDRVEVAFYDSTLTNYKVIKKLRQHTKKAVAGNTGSKSNKTPNSVKPGKADNKTYKIENNLMKLDVPIHQLATAYINRLVGTAFTKFNNNITKFITKGLGEFGCNHTPIGDVILDPFHPEFVLNPTCPNVIECGLAKCPPPVITCGGDECSGDTPGFCDLTRDMQRMCEPSASGNSIGKISSIVRINGSCLDMKDFAFENICTSCTNMTIDDKGNMKIKPNTPPGVYVSAFLMGSRLWTPEEYAVIASFDDPEFTNRIDHYWSIISVAYTVVENIMDLDFSKSVNFILDNMPDINIGPLFEEFKHLPSIDFKMDLKETDKAIFGQLHVEGSLGLDTPSMELSYSIGFPEDK